jgi:hypothetical protein
MADHTTRSAQWPKNPSSFSSQLRRLSPRLRTIGIIVEFDRQRNGRVIRISPARDLKPIERQPHDDQRWPSGLPRVTPRVTRAALEAST